MLHVPDVDRVLGTGVVGDNEPAVVGQAGGFAHHGFTGGQLDPDPAAEGGGVRPVGAEGVV